MFSRFCAALALLFAASPAAAWWDYGHRTIARIAEQQAKPGTRRSLARLLKGTSIGTPGCAARTIEEASIWADCIKKLGDRYDFAFAWHFQNVAICRPFDQASACKDGNCISAQIDRHRRLLADKALPPRDRLTALAFLVHLVGDLHNPMHAADNGDLGGNRLRVAYGAIRGSNLHLVWDGYLAERAISTPPGGTGLLAGFSAADRAAMRRGSVDDWARESWEVGRRDAYGALLQDPCGGAPAADLVVDERLTRRLIPVVRLQVARAGLRLARLLDEALA